VWEKGTERAMSLALRSCSFAEVSLSRIQRSHVEAWIKTFGRRPRTEHGQDPLRQRPQHPASSGT
jgi:hypothetical protein